MLKINCLKVAKFVLILLIAPLVFAANFTLQKVYAQTSSTINFQGKIVRNDTGYEGLNVTTGSPACVLSGADTCDFQVKYYSASTSGTLYFTETYTNVEIGQYGGIFNLSLGSGTPTSGAYSSLDATIQAQNTVYVEVLFSPAGTSSFTETFSRMPLQASAYAIKSKYAEMAKGAFKFENAANSTGYTGSDGMVYYDTTSGVLKLYSAGVWQDVATGGASIWGSNSITAYSHSPSQFLETSGIATLSNFGVDATVNRAWVQGASSRTGFSVYSNYGGATDWPLVTFKADASNFGNSILQLIQDGTGNILEGVGGSTPVFNFDKKGDLHLSSNGINYFEPFAAAPVSGDLTPVNSEGCLYNVASVLYWDPICNYNGVAVSTGSSSRWTDAGSFTYLTATTDDLVLGGNSIATSTFFFDIDASGGNYLEIDNADNSQRLFTIDANGNVGIGTATPGAKLDIGGSNSNITNSTGDITITPNQNLILGSGNFGVGTAIPNQKLSVAGTFGIIETGSTPTYYTIFQGGDQSANITYTLPTTSTTGILANNGSGVLSWTTLSSLGGVTGTGTGSGTAGQITFWSGTSTITGSNNFWWDNTNQRLGIGTNNPQSTIDIAGATSEIANTTGPVVILPANGNLRISGPGSYESGSFLTFGDSNYVKIGEYTSGDTDTLHLFGDGGVNIETSGGSMIVNNQGNVGIGVSPTKKLEVAGDMKMYYTNTGTGSTNIFDTTYTQSVAAPAGTIYGYYNKANYTATGTMLEMGAAKYDAQNDSTGTITRLYALDANVFNKTTGTVTTAAAIHARGFQEAYAGTISALHGILIDNAHKGSGGTITGQSGLTIASLNSGTYNTYLLLNTTTIPSANYAIYSASSYSSYFAGSITATTFSGALNGNATTATNLSTTRGDWSTNGTISAVVGQLAWKNYGNGHTIFDASNSTSPSGSAVNSTNPGVAWQATYPTLMGWNGSNTYGVRVDSARYAEQSSGNFTVGGRIVQDGWSAPTLVNSWVNYGSGYSNAGYFLDKNCIVHVRGLVKNGTSRLITTLPTGYRPAYVEIFIVWNNISNARVDIGANGTISVVSSYSNAFLSLDGITFRATGCAGGADLAEHYPSPSSSSINEGDIVSIDSNHPGSIINSSVPYDSKVLGIISTKPGDTLGQEVTEGTHQTRAVALSGRVPTKVWSKNGSIKFGDYLTTSELQGFGIKAVRSGAIVGKPLEEFDPIKENRNCPSVNSVNDIVWPTDTDGTNSAKPCFKLPDGTYVGKIMIFVNISQNVSTQPTFTKQISTPGWYRISQLSGPDDYAKVKINNSALGSSQNLMLSVDTVNSNNNINVISNFTTGGNHISKARVNTVYGIKYLEVYLGSVNSNILKVDVDGNLTNWTATEITKVDDGLGIVEYALEGVIFGVSDTFSVSKDSITTSGTLLTSGLTSNIGNSGNRWNDIYTKGTIRLGSGSSEGGIRYNVEKKRLEFSNDGEIWIEMGDLTSSVVISPEYSGAILYADGSDNYGKMTSDAIETGGIFKNYYEWKSDRETLQDYDILVRITLPTDFVSWKENAISLDFMTENSASVANNKVDIALMGNSGIDGEVKDGISKLPGSWERVSIKSTDITQCKKAGDSCTLRLSMHSKENYFVRVGDISLNYNRGL